MLHNGVVHTDSDNFDSINDEDAEFDLTAQLDEEMQSPIERLRRDRSAFRAKEKRGVDDLDII